MSFLRKYWLGLLGLTLLVGGGVFVGVAVATRSASDIAFRQPSVVLSNNSATTPVDIRPVRLSIVRLGLDVSVIQGEFNAESQSWSLDRQHAFYLAPGQAPLQTQSWPLIYGHARSEIFAPLAKAERGDILLVTGDDGREYTYVLSGSVSVKPDQGAIINDSPEGRGLQLLTCEGFNFEKRRILYFTLVGEHPEQKAVTI